MQGGRYLKDKVALYAILAIIVAVFASIVLMLPYDTVYVRERTYLRAFLYLVIVCVAVFLLGTLYNMLVWMHGKGLTGSPEGRLLRLIPKAVRFIVSRRFGKALSVLWHDAINLSRLKERSAFRWLVHFLILGGFVLMFVLDLIVTFSLDILKYEPMIDEEGWAKLWIRDFGFELVGFMLLMGLLMTAVRRFVFRPKILKTELPDAASIIFLLVVVLGGFILEGMGIAGHIQGHQTNEAYSFVGYALSLAMPASAGDYYDHVWFVHAVLSSLLIAYIPFSKLFHMIATPIAIEVEGMLSKEGAPS